MKTPQEYIVPVEKHNLNKPSYILNSTGIKCNDVLDIIKQVQKDTLQISIDLLHKVVLNEEPIVARMVYKKIQELEKLQEEI